MEKHVLYRPAGTHPTPLTCMSVHPREKSLACGTLDSEIIILEIDSGKPKKALRGHDGKISNISYIENGKSILSTSWDCTTRRWKPRGSTDTPVLRHQTEVKALAINSDSTKGAAGARDGEVKVFSSATLKCIRNLQVHSRDVSGIAFTKNLNYLVTTSWDGKCVVWDLSTYEKHMTLASEKEKIRSLAITPDDSRVFLGLHNGKILSINLEDRKDRIELSGHGDIVTSLAISPDGSSLASGGWDRIIRLWSLGNNKQQDEGRLLTGVSSIAWSPSGTQFFSTDFSGSLISWRKKD
ncbi:MAG: WD40 repeat domain-containing protein [Candidatus Hodarchaeota archaeon]